MVLIYTPAVYLPLGDFYRETNVFAVKVDPLNLESQNEAKNFPEVLPRSPIKIWVKSVLQVPMIGQTNRYYNFIYIYRYWMQEAKFSLLINIFKDLQVIIKISFFVGNLV